MRAVVRLTVAGLRRRGLGQLAAIVLVAALATSAVVAGLTALHSSSRLLDAAYERAGRPDLVLYGAEDDLRSIAEDTEVDAAGEPAPVSGIGTVTVGGEPVDLLLMGMDPDALPPVGTPHLVDGSWPATGAGDEVVVERSLVAEGITSVGGTLAVDRADGSGESISLRVVGSVVDLSDCFWPLCDPLRVFAPPSVFDHLTAGTTVDTHVSSFRLTDPSVAAALHGRLTSDPVRDVGGSFWGDTRDDVLVIGTVFSSMLSGFGLFLLVVACLVVAGATAARLVARRRSLALLKAVGFRPSQLTSSLLAEHLVLGAGGVALGWVLGSLVAPSVQAGVGGVLDEGGVRFELGPLLVALVLVETFLALSVTVPAWRAGRQPATTVLRDAPPAPGGGRWIAALARTLGAGPAIVTGLRRSFAHPARAVLAGGAIVVATTGAIVAAGQLQTLDRAMADPAQRGLPWDAYAYGTGAGTGADSGADDLEAGLARMDEVAGWHTEQESTGVVDGIPFTVRVIGGDPGEARYRVVEGRNMGAPDETLTGYGFLRANDLEVGDRVSMEVDGRSLDLTVVGWYHDFTDSGEVAQVRTEAVPDLQSDNPLTWRITAANGVSPAALASAVEAELGPGVVAAAVGSNDGGLGAINGAVVTVAALLALVAFANLVAVTLAATRERARSLGVQRAIGATTGQLIGQSCVGAAAIGLPAALIGLVLGSWIFRIMTDTIATASGVGPGLGVAPSALFLALLVPIATLVAAAAGGLSSASIARRPAAELVRYE